MSVMKESREERDTLLEGRAQAFTVQSEQKLISKINALHGRYEALQQQLQKNQLGVKDGDASEKQLKANPAADLINSSPTELVLE